MASSNHVEGLAAIVLAHRAPAQVHRLLDTLAGADLFVHCDRKTPEPVASDLLGGVRQRGGTVLPRRDLRLSSWSMVQLELDALRIALESSSAPHIAVMSGADYPVVSPTVLNEALASWSGRTWMRSVPLPYPAWDTRFAKDGGLWRWRWYTPTLRDNVIGSGARVATIPARRRIPSGLELRSSPHWKIYDRTDAQALLAVLDSNPQLVKFGRHTFIPEESFVASVLASRLFMRDRAVSARPDGPWYVNWSSKGPVAQHPGVLDVSDMTRLAGRVAGGRAGADGWGKAVFARKFPDSMTVYDETENVVWPASAR